MVYLLSDLKSGRKTAIAVVIFTHTDSIPPKPFFPRSAIRGISPVLTDPGRCRKMAARRILLEEQARELRGGT